MEDPEKKDPHHKTACGSILFYAPGATRTRGLILRRAVCLRAKTSKLHN